MAIKFLLEKSALNYGLFSLGKEPMPNPDELFLYVNSTTNQYSVIKYNQQMPISIIKSNKFDTRYRLSTEIQNFKLQNQFMSKQTKYYFDVSISFQVSLMDPIKYTEHHNIDVEYMLNTRLNSAFESFCGDINVLDYKSARTEFKKCVSGLNIPVELLGYGLRVDHINSHFELTKEAEKFYQRMVEQIDEEEALSEVRVKSEKIKANEDRKIREINREIKRNELKEIMEEFREQQLTNGPQAAIIYLKEAAPNYYEHILSIYNDRKLLVQEFVNIGMTPEYAAEIVELQFNPNKSEPKAEQKIEKKPEELDIFSMSSELSTDKDEK